MLPIRGRKEMVEHAGAAAIVAVDASDHVLFVRQRRLTVGEVLLELTAGLVEEGEDPLDAARRELREETGATGGNWQQLAGFYSSPGYSTEWLWIYLATNLTMGPGF